MNARLVRFVAALVLCAWTLLGSVPALEACGRLEGTAEASHHGLETALLSATRHCVVESRSALDHVPTQGQRPAVELAAESMRLFLPPIVGRVPAPPPNGSSPLRYKLLSVYRL